jgi:dTDP-4-amino-4,6-dideoxygalactose transaminase
MAPVHPQGLGGKPGDFPESERASQDTLALPIYPELTEEMLRYVALLSRPTDITSADVTNTV